MRSLRADSAVAGRRIAAIAFAACVVVTAALVAIPRPSEAAPTPPWFGPNVKVNVPPAYTAYQPSLAVGTDGFLYLAFAGWGGSTTQGDVFFTKSINGGRSWTSPLRVNNDVGGAAQAEPTLALGPGNTIYLAWTDQRTGSPEVYFAKSTDGGLSFSTNVRVNDVVTSFQSEPSITVDHVGLVHVVWTDNRNSFTTGPDIYYGNSTDGGFSFNPNTRVNNDATGGEQARPAVAVGPDRSVYVVWDDPRNGARGRDIYFSRSTDLGDTWTPNFGINDDTGSAAQTEATIAVNPEGGIFVAWTDSRTANTAPDIYATRSTNGGASFAGNVKVNDDTAAAWQGMPSIAARAGGVAVAWIDTRTWGSTQFDLYWAPSEDGLSWGASAKVNDDALPNVAAWTPTISFDAAGDLFAAWLDTRTSGQDVFAAALDVIAPSADAGGDMTVDQGTAAPYDGSASSDNLGIASYAWDFGDGSTATGASGSHVYADAGVYTCTLTVWDYSGNPNSASVLVTVRDTEDPVVLGAGDRTVDEGQPLYFDAGASTDNVGVVSWDWDFGDGGTATGPSPTHVYDRPGTYTANVTVADAAGNTDTATMVITVRTVAPKAAELLGMIQILVLVVGVLGALLAFVGYLAWTTWRRSRGGARSPRTAPEPPAPPGDLTRQPDPLDLPPPDTEPPQYR